MQLLIHAGIEVDPCQQKGSLVILVEWYEDITAGMIHDTASSGLQPRAGRGISRVIISRHSAVTDSNPPTSGG